MIKNPQDYSYVMKLLQVGAVLIAMGFLLFTSKKAEAHVEIHMDLLSWDIERQFDLTPTSDVDILNLMYPPEEEVVPLPPIEQK